MAPLVLLAILCTFLFPPSAFMAGGPVFVLRPHCEGDPCPPFPTRDPRTRATPILAIGDTLDMDLLIENPLGQAIHRTEVRIAYDSTILEGISLELADAFPLPVPGESDFFPESGIIRISASADGEGTTEPSIVVARLRMRVTSVPAQSTVLSFESSGEDRGGIFTGPDTLEENVLASDDLGQLLVRLAGSAPSGELPPTPSSPAITETSASPTAPPPSPPPAHVFTLLQVQNLRAGTEGSSLFLAWDPLPSSQLIGYNVYYSTTSGEYVQRRSSDAGTTSLTLRSLPPHARYYVAVRGVSSENTETAFSQEVAVTIGDPRSSTAPLTASLTTPRRSRATVVAGGTGLPSPMILLLLTSATIGTLLACRRQCIASIARP